MNTTEAIRARRSIRKYKKGAVIPPSDIDMLLEAAMCAPSAMNKRPWNIIVVESADMRKKIADVFGPEHFLHDASIAVVICGAPKPLNEFGREGFWPQACAAATQNLMLQATELGYGTCWCGMHPGDRVPAITKILGIKDVIPLSLIAVGVPDEKPDAKGFLDKDKVRYI